MDDIAYFLNHFLIIESNKLSLILKPIIVSVF